MAIPNMAVMAGAHHDSRYSTARIPDIIAAVIRMKGEVMVGLDESYKSYKSYRKPAASAWRCSISRPFMTEAPKEALRRMNSVSAGL